MLLTYVKSHSLKLLSKLTGRAARAVSQKEKVFVIVFKPFDKFLYMRDKEITVIDNTVHITYKIVLVAYC